jgi:hypothetical protein
MAAGTAAGGGGAKSGKATGGRAAGRASGAGAGAGGSASQGGGAQGLALIAQLAGATLLSQARDVAPGETLVLGTAGELRWARQNLPSGMRVFDKDGFVQALLHQRLEGVKPAFVV